MFSRFGIPTCIEKCIMTLQKRINQFHNYNRSCGHWLHTQIFIQVGDTDDETGISDDNDDETSDDSGDSDAKVQE